MDPLVTAMIVHYEAEPAMLRRCLDSLRAQTYPSLEVVLVDNGSGPGALDPVAAGYPEVQVVRLPRNLGFAAGVNRGIAAARGELVLPLNFDVELDPDCVGELVKVLAEEDDLAGVAPKTVFMHDRHLIDSVGNLIDPFGSAYNMGIGQLDIGQYDLCERVFGVCFAAALCRKVAFGESAVGPLDESYFLYYEDVDWCYRANLLGWRFRTAPRAVVAHVHSAAARRLDYAVKYYLIQRNLLRTVVKNFEGPRALHVLARRLLDHLANAVRRGPFWGAGLRAVMGLARRLPRDWRARRRLQPRRRVSDPAIFRYSAGERPHFDPVRYAPLYRLVTLEAMYRRRFVVTGDARSGEIAAALGHLAESKLGLEPEPRARLERELFGDEPAFVRDFFRKVGA